MATKKIIDMDYKEFCAKKYGTEYVKRIKSTLIGVTDADVFKNKNHKTIWYGDNFENEVTSEDLMFIARLTSPIPTMPTEYYIVQDLILDTCCDYYESTE